MVSVVGCVLGRGGAQPRDDVALVERLLNELHLRPARWIALLLQSHDLHEYELEVLEQIAQRGIGSGLRVDQQACGEQQVIRALVNASSGRESLVSAGSAMSRRRRLAEVPRGRWIEGCTSATRAGLDRVSVSDWGTAGLDPVSVRDE